MCIRNSLHVPVEFRILTDIGILPPFYFETFCPRYSDRLPLKFILSLENFCDSMRFLLILHFRAQLTFSVESLVFFVLK